MGEGGMGTYHDILEVIAYILAKSPLLMTPIILPIAAPRVPRLPRTLIPRLHHLRRVPTLHILRNDHPSIQHRLALTVTRKTGVAPVDRIGVDGHRNGGCWGDVPFVE